MRELDVLLVAHLDAAGEGLHHAQGLGEVGLRLVPPVAQPGDAGPAVGTEAGPGEQLAELGIGVVGALQMPQLDPGIGQFDARFGPARTRRHRLLEGGGGRIQQLPVPTGAALEQQSLQVEGARMRHAGG